MVRITKEKDILPVREQYRIRDEILGERLRTLLPELMKECGVQAWLVLSRENAEDPVFKTLVPSLVKYASRFKCLGFFLSEDGKFEALNLSRPDGRLTPYYQQVYRGGDPMDTIAQAVAQRSPEKVCVNVSDVTSQADGLSKSLWDELYAALGDRLVGDDRLAVRWMETRTQRELDLYPSIYRIASEILREAYSRNVITPGVTTTTDVEYYIMQRIDDMGLSAWFAPDVDVQRCGTPGRLTEVVIQEGDLIHTDYGLEYLGLCTDSQRLGYLLREGETQIPQGLLRGLAVGNRFQDIVREEMLPGRSGNEIFAHAVRRAKAEGIRPSLYTHPIGVYGHAAGPTIGLWDQQGDVPGAGEMVHHENTCYALELNVTETVPEWNAQDVGFYIEETVACTKDSVSFLDDFRDHMIVI